MKNTQILRRATPTPRAAILLIALLGWCPAVFGGIIVPATADADLAGMPNGSSSPPFDSAPANSPVQVTSMPIVPGSPLYFSATGLATVDGAGFPYADPNGYAYPGGPFPGAAGSTNGISRPTGAPSGSLLGVFLDGNQPNLSSAPPPLDFSPSGNVPSGLYYGTLTPGLKQIFFIGDGQNAGFAFSGIPQGIIVPAGATRLYLGYADYGQAWNNAGSFDVTVVPEPGALALVLAGGLTMFGWRLKQRWNGRLTGVVGLISLGFVGLARWKAFSRGA